SVSRVCGPALRSLLSCLASCGAQKGSQPVATRQRAFYRHRIRYSPWARFRQGSLFGVIAETSPALRSASPIGHEPPRFDWIGRPEQTNMRLNNPAMAGTDDLRDLWNQQTP